MTSSPGCASLSGRQYHGVSMLAGMDGYLYTVEDGSLYRTKE